MATTHALALHPHQGPSAVAQKKASQQTNPVGCPLKVNNGPGFLSSRTLTQIASNPSDTNYLPQNLKRLHERRASLAAEKQDILKHRDNSTQLINKPFGHRNISSSNLDLSKKPSVLAIAKFSRVGSENRLNNQKVASSSSLNSGANSMQAIRNTSTATPTTNYDSSTDLSGGETRTGTRRPGSKMLIQAPQFNAGKANSNRLVNQRLRKVTSNSMPSRVLTSKEKAKEEVSKSGQESRIEASDDVEADDPEDVEEADPVKEEWIRRWLEDTTDADTVTEQTIPPDGPRLVDKSYHIVYQGD